MDWNIDIDNIYNLVDEEVSRAADSAYSDDGVSLYDNVVLSARDKDTVLRFIGDAVQGIQARLFDVARIISPTEVHFHLPDFDPSYETSAKAELTRYIVMAVCASLFRQTRAVLVQEYTDRAQLAINNAVVMLKTRKSPADIW